MNKNLSDRRRSRTAKGIFIGALLALALGVPTKIAHAQILNLTSFHDAGQHVFYVSFDNHLHHVYCSIQGCAKWANQDLTAQTGISVGSVSGAIASYSDTAGMHVFVVDDSGNLILHKLDCLSSCDQARNWTARTLASNVMGLTGYSDPQSILLYYRSGAHVWVTITSYDETIDLTLQTGAPPPASVYFTAFSDASGEHVFYQDINGHVCQITGQWAWVGDGDNFYQDVNWSKWDGTGDLTAQAGGTPETFTGTGGWASPLTSFSDALGEHVAYIGTDQHVYEYRYDVNAGQWQPPQDLSRAGKPSLPWSALTSFADSLGERIYYVGASGDIFRLYRNSCVPWGDGCTWGDWTDLDFTKTANGAPPRSTIDDLPQLTSFSQYTEYVFYIGQPDCHIHRITLWVDQDLTPGLSCSDDSSPR